MKKKIILFFLLITILGFSLPSIAQFEPEEIAERAEWEEFLQTAKVVDQVQMGGARSGHETVEAHPGKRRKEK